MEDQHIFALLWDHAEGALDALNDAYGRRLYSIAFHILENRQDAEECVNDAILALWNAIPPNRPHSLFAYACGVTRNIALNRLRKTSSQYTISLSELAECIPTQTGQTDARELGRIINYFLGTVSTKNRNIFLRRYWFGDSVKEIAAIFSMSENAVSVRLNRTRNKLKVYLTKEGYYEE